MSKSLVCVDLSQNQITPRSAPIVSQILTENNSIIDLNLGSLQGSERNRLGKDGGIALA